MNKIFNKNDLFPGNFPAVDNKKFYIWKLIFSVLIDNQRISRSHAFIINSFYNLFYNFHSFF